MSCQPLLLVPLFVCLRLIGSGRLSRRHEAGTKGDWQKLSSLPKPHVLLGAQYSRSGPRPAPANRETQSLPNRIRGPAGSRLQLPGVLKRANPGHGLIRPVSSTARPTAGEELYTLYCQTVIYNLIPLHCSYSTPPEVLFDFLATGNSTHFNDVHFSFPFLTAMLLILFFLRFHLNICNEPVAPTSVT